MRYRVLLDKFSRVHTCFDVANHAFKNPEIQQRIAAFSVKKVKLEIKSATEFKDGLPTCNISRETVDLTEYQRYAPTETRLPKLEELITQFDNCSRMRGREISIRRLEFDERPEHGLSGNCKTFLSAVKVNKRLCTGHKIVVASSRIFLEMALAEDHTRLRWVFYFY